MLSRVDVDDKTRNMEIHTVGPGALGQAVNWAEVKLPARAENVAVARAFVMGLMAARSESNWDVTVSVLDEVKVAVSEAVSNAIIHGYANDEARAVRIYVEQYARALLVQVVDDGVGIADVERAKQPDFSTKEEHLGLGFAFMESFMDEVWVKSAPGVGTEVTLVKYFPEGERAWAVPE